MPTGAALLLAVCALLAAGFGERAASALGIGRGACGAWAICIAAASGINLGLPGNGPAAVLVNPGGCLVPMAFALFLLFSAMAGTRSRCLKRGLWAAGATAILLAAGTAYGEQLGATGTAAALSGCGVAAVALILGGEARGALVGVAAGLALSSAVLALTAGLGWTPWPPALGGGPTFDAGILGAVGTQVLDRVVAAWRAQQVGSTGLRASPH